MKKIILTIAVFCFLFFNCLGQEIEWQNTIGGNSVDKLNSLIQTSDGGYLLGGSSASAISGDKTENCVGGTFEDYWVIKTDANGTFQWQNTVGGTSIDELYAVAQATDGGYYVGGYSGSDSSGDKTENNCNFAYDYWVIKLDSAGNIQWQNDIGGDNTDEVTTIAATSDGGCIAGGFSYSNASCDKSEGNWGVSSTDYWAVKLDAAGTIQWENTIGGSATDRLHSIKQTSDGGYICGGWSTSGISGDKTENLSGYADYWVVKLDAAGNIQWQNTIGGSDDDELYSIAQTSDGGYICGGYSQSSISGDKTENSYGDWDYWVVKLDAGGTVQWDKTVGGNDFDFLYSIAQTSDGGYICGGESRSNSSGNKTENSLGGDDYWVVKLDSAGTLQSQNTFGGTSVDKLNCIIKTSDGGYLCGGYSQSPLSGDKSENGLGGGYDYWVVKLTDKYNSITGKLFIDANSNGIKDAGEPTVRSKTVTETNTGRMAFSNQAGVYKVSVLDTGNFSVHPESINYYTAVPAAHAVNFSGIQQTDSLNDFAFQPAGVYNDLCLTLTSMGGYSPGFDANFMISYENVGTTTMNGEVILFPDSNLSFLSSVPAPASITADSIIWNFTTLSPFQSDNILVTLRVDSLTPIGTYITSSARIEPVLGDANIECNNGFASGVVTGSCDPNAIVVDRDTVLTTELSNPPYLNYIIYFQNTGNDTAVNARVLNNIPQMLDLNSFEFVASSHPLIMEYTATSRLVSFRFHNINLPDSNVNETSSHGFVRYKIKPVSALVAGDIIRNNAAIYFDFNQPVLTDTAMTEIVLPTGIESFGFEVSGFGFYPNPVSDELTVRSKQFNEKGTIRIFDLFGREVFQLETRNLEPETKIDVSHFSQGIYFVELQSGEKVLRGKFLKE